MGRGKIFLQFVLIVKRSCFKYEFYMSANDLYKLIVKDFYWHSRTMISLTMFLFLFFACGSLDISSAEENVDALSKLPCEYNIVETLTRMEVQLETIEKKMQQSELTTAALDTYVKDISNKMTQHETSMKSIREEPNTLKYQTSSNTNAIQTGVVPLVAFSVYSPTKLSMAEGEIIIFQSVQMNEGAGYNSISGRFTAPVGGLYHFSAHFCNSGTKYFAYAIIHIVTEVARSTSLAQLSGCGSVSALVRAKKGDHVYMQTTANTNHLEENRWRRASFIGVLVHN